MHFSAWNAWPGIDVRPVMESNAPPVDVPARQRLLSNSLNGPMVNGNKSDAGSSDAEGMCGDGVGVVL